MKNYVIENYENYKEEDRLTTNNARRIEFVNTVKIFKEHIKKKSKILDCAAGTGIYAFYLAEQGHDVTATDITPRHINIINKNLSDKGYDMKTAVLAKQLIEIGISKHSDKKSFWTDSYYSSKEEMEQLYARRNLKIIDYFGQDGMAPLLSNQVDQWNESEFDVWCQYHYDVCREPSILGASNHVIIIGKKSFEETVKEQRVV